MVSGVLILHKVRENMLTSWSKMKLFFFLMFPFPAPHPWTYCSRGQHSPVHTGKRGSALQGRMQCTAGAVAVHCRKGCSALRLRWVKLAPISPVLFWIREEGEKIESLKPPTWIFPDFVNAPPKFNWVIRHFDWLPFIAVCSVFVTFIADKVINLVCGVFIFAVHAISRVTIYGCVVYAYIYHFR